MIVVQIALHDAADVELQIHCAGAVVGRIGRHVPDARGKLHSTRDRGRFADHATPVTTTRHTSGPHNWSLFGRMSVLTSSRTSASAPFRFVGMKISARIDPKRLSRDERRNSRDQEVPA